MSRGKAEKAKLEYLRQTVAARSAEAGCHALRLVLDGLNPDFNIGKIYRTAETFALAGVDLVGIEWFDPGPAVGAFKKVPTRRFAAFAECKRALLEEGYTLFALAPGAGTRLGEAELPERTALVLGNEAQGLSFDPQSEAGVAPLRIPQWGRSQSLNVSVAAAVAVWEYLRCHGRLELEVSSPAAAHAPLRGHSPKEAA